MKRDLKELLVEMRQNARSVMAFNVQDLYQIESAILTANKAKAPIIIQFSERFLRFLDGKYGMNFLLQKYNSDHIYFHLDHCNDIPFIKYCVESGFDSVMYDGSAFDVHTNIINSKSVISYARTKNCIVEGELGKVAGVEDGFGDEGSSYAEINEIERYINETGIDLMALGIGNAHGFYNNLDGINMDILIEASKRLDPHQLYVLHGATGLPDKLIQEAINYGVVKINVSTHLKKRTMEILDKFLKENELYNEIAFDTMMREELSLFYSGYINKYTI